MATSLQLWRTAHDKLLVMVEVLHTVLASLASCHPPRTQVPANKGKDLWGDGLWRGSWLPGSLTELLKTQVVTYHRACF